MCKSILTILLCELESIEIMLNPPKTLAVQGSRGESSHRSGSRRSRERSLEFAKHLSNSPDQQGHRNATIDAMSRALRRVTQSPFFYEIERAQMSQRFN